MGRDRGHSRASWSISILTYNNKCHTKQLDDTRHILFQFDKKIVNNFDTFNVAFLKN